MDEQELGSSGSVDTSVNLDSAVEAISHEAPKLSGMEKLKAAKEHVEKTGELPPKPGEKPAAVRGADGKFQGQVKPAPAVAGAQKTAVVPPPADPNAPAAAYTPDFKYKAGGKELEIPEKFRALITDKASEEEVKKLFGQAATLEEFKTTANALKTQMAEKDNTLLSYKNGVTKLRSFVQKNDFDNFFKGMNIPAEKIYQWVLDKVQYNQLPADQKAQIDAQRNLQQQNEQAQEGLSRVNAERLELATRMKGMELEQTLGRADVKSMQEAFDSRVGRPGAFRDAVIEHGKSVWALSNQTIDLTPEQAVADFVKKYGNPSSFAPQNPAAEAATPGAVTPPSANATPPVKVIPNVAGRSASPIKQKPRSIEDLKKLRDKAVAEENAGRSPSQGYLAG